ncbi:thermonuclease family protein [Rhizobium sp. 18055]|uniref:thermonuclease family protein n=1 Tax=Rhizobium sp. 18055 TaxID=2681403 RepID=UPI001358608B|nr:thermonuclease family protein [Rhizobium sp. 18055]
MTHLRPWMVAILANIIPIGHLAAEETIAFPSSVEIETGDTWSYQGQRYRLYGVQSCLRGSEFVAADGVSSDCGARSMAPLAALLLTETVACQPIGKAKDQATFVVCAANLNGNNIDVGTALISTGSSFAAVYPTGEPVSKAYLVAEMTARSGKAGLWSGRFQHPVQMLLNSR